MRHAYKLFLALVCVLPIATQAQIPNKLSYQGLLTTTGGAFVADGNYDLKFDIYNAASSGTLRHRETQTAVPVRRGTFSVLLGSAATLPAIFGEPLFVEVTVLAGPGISSPLTFSPRAELSSAPYALAPWATSGTTISYSTGNVGIGTTTPNMSGVDRSLTISALPSGQLADVEIQGNTTIDSDFGSIDFFNGSNRNTVIATRRAGANNSSHLDFYTSDAGNLDRRMRIDKTGNVGIGTNSPSYKLDVNGIINATDIYKNGVPFSGGGSSQWTTTGSDIFYNLGNVGIGATSPGSLLQVGSSTTRGTLAVTGPITPAISLTDTRSGGGNWTFYTGVAAIGDLNIFDQTNSTFAMTFQKGTGKIGIGTTSPEDARVTIRSGTGGPNGLLRLTSDNDSPAFLEAYRGSTNTRLFQLTYDGTPQYSAVQNMFNYSGTKTMQLHAGGDTYFNGGNVGIGTTSPSYKLDVNGIINATDIYKNGVPFSGGGSSQWTTSGSDIYYNSGNVGIGTTNLADARVTIRSGTGGPNFLLRLTSDNDAPGFLEAYRGSNNKNMFALSYDGPTVATYSAVQSMYDFAETRTVFLNAAGASYFNGGNVGIGTTNPGIPGHVNKLHVVGDATGGPVSVVLQGSGNMSTNNSVGFQARGTISGTEYLAQLAVDRFFHSAGITYLGSNAPGGIAFSADNTAEHMRINPFGNVGIGTTIPSEKLEVAGNVKIGNATIRSGTGSPEGAVAGNVGDLFLRTDGGPGSTMYVKESGNATSTGWAAK